MDVVEFSRTQILLKFHDCGWLRWSLSYGPSQYHLILERHLILYQICHRRPRERSAEVRTRHGETLFYDLGWVPGAMFHGTYLVRSKR